MFEISVLRKVFVPRREEVTGYWRELRSAELHEVCFSQNVDRVI